MLTRQMTMTITLRLNIRMQESRSMCPRLVPRSSHITSESIKYRQISRYKSSFPLLDKKQGHKVRVHQVFINNNSLRSRFQAYHPNKDFPLGSYFRKRPFLLVLITRNESKRQAHGAASSLPSALASFTCSNTYHNRVSDNDKSR
jgi:hypothetical protein